MEVDRKVWRKVRRRLNGPTEGDLSRVGGSSSPLLSGQPSSQVVENREECKLITTLEGGLVRWGLEVKLKWAMVWDTEVVQDCWRVGWASQKLKGKTLLKGGPGSCLRSKGVRGGRKKIGKFVGKRTSKPVIGNKKMKGKSGGVSYLSLIDWLQTKAAAVTDSDYTVVH